MGQDNGWDMRVTTFSEDEDEPEEVTKTWNDRVLELQLAEVSGVPSVSEEEVAEGVMLIMQAARIRALERELRDMTTSRDAYQRQADSYARMAWRAKVHDG